MDVKVLDSDPYLKHGGGWKTCFGMLSLVKSDILRGTRVGNSTFLSKNRSIILYVTRGGRGFPNPMQLDLNEGINLVERGSVIMKTNPR